jgi:peroxiredoxin
MRYEAEGGDPANAGLQHARTFLEPVKGAHPWVTYADLWTLAGVVAIEAMGGPAIPWREGRSDFADDSTLPPRGRLPDGSKAADHLRQVFYRMGCVRATSIWLDGTDWGAQLQRPGDRRALRCP